jgi:osmoprotectant transport system substrate-binding protein
MTNRPLRWALALLVPFALLAAACGDDDDGREGAQGGEGTCSEGEAADDAPEIVIGAQDFGESRILSELYAQCLEAAGYTVSIQELGGFRDLEVAAFESGDINFAAEYAASMLEFLNGDETEATSDVEQTVQALNERLEAIDLQALDSSAAVDTNAFVVTQDTSEELGLTTISDLADHQDLTLGAPADCETNAFCLPGLEEVYGVDLSDGFTALETGAIADALDAGEIDIALLFSTDSRIAANNWVLLEDDETMLAADNILPVLTNALNQDNTLRTLANLLSGTLTTANVTEMNRRFDVDREDASAVAADFLAEQGLLT